MLELLLVMARREKKIRVSRAHRHMRDNIRYIGRNDCRYAYRNIFIAHDFICYDHRWSLIFRALNRSQGFNDFHLPCPASATYNLPIPDMRGLAQQRIEVSQQGRERKSETGTAHDFFAEEFDRPIFGVETMTQVFGF